MTTNTVTFREAAQGKILKGVQTLSNAVKATLGPRGRNVLIEQDYGVPQTTKDGITVARSITLKDPLESMGAQMVREASSKTADMAGDGTTTSVVLAEAIYTEGMKAVSSGANPILIKRGIDKAVVEAVKAIRAQAKPITTQAEIESVATGSANWDASIGKMIAGAFEKVGKDGVITIEDSNTAESTIDIVDGMQIDRGYVSPYFVTNDKRMTCELENPYILLYETRLDSLNTMLPVLQEVFKTGRSLLMIAQEIEGELLPILVVNKLQKGFKLCAVKAPSFGEDRHATMEDIATLTGAKYITTALGVRLENVQLSDLGSARRVIIDKDKTTIIDGAGSKEAVDTRIAQVKEQISQAKQDYERTSLQERLGRLIGGIAAIRVGAPTEPELKEKKDRLDDSLRATRSALEEGIVAGGGAALLHTAKAVEATETDNDAERLGVQIIRKALESPLRTLCENAGRSDYASIIKQVIDNSHNAYGFDVAKESFGDLVTQGIIDPAKVTRCALENAASVAGLLLTSEVAITNDREEQKPHAQPSRNQ